MKKEPKLNVRLLRRIENYIMEEPRRFAMTIFAVKRNEVEEQEAVPFDWSRTPPPCGTTACIAGTAAILSGKTIKEAEKLTTRWYNRLLGLPRKMGGLDFSSHPLFWHDCWPDPYCFRYRDAKTPRARAKVACARIEHLIKHGE